MTGGFSLESSDDLLSQAVTHQVSSAQKGLTTVFGMGTGVAPSLLPLDSKLRPLSRAVCRSFLFRCSRTTTVRSTPHRSGSAIRYKLLAYFDSRKFICHKPSKLDRKVEFHELVKTSTD